MYAYLPYDVAPFAFCTRDCHSFFMDAYLTSAQSGVTELAAALGVQFEPHPFQVLDWIQSIAAEATTADGRLSNAQLRVAVNALLVLGSLNDSPERDRALDQCLAPNSNAVLVPAEQLVVSDAPWLQGRVDLRRINLVHPKLTREAGSFTLSARGGRINKLNGGGASGMGWAGSCGRRSSLVSSASVASVPGARAAAVSARRALLSCPWRTRAQA